jgi:hypothetical protein
MGLTTEGLSVTANEQETSAGPSNGQGGADDELWLTYLNYDQRIQQAVRRLGALSNENVEVFRSLLLKGRDRSRLKDYEAESVRRLQGEAFVGDEELQRTLIVLNAEDPRYGEELKRLVRATGKPEQLDQAVAAIRSGKPLQIKPVAVPDLPPSPPPVKAEEPVEVPQEPAKDPVVVPLRKETVAPAAAKPAMPTPRMVLREEPAPRRSLKPLLLVGGALVIAAIAAAWLMPGLLPSNRIAVQAPVAPPPPKPQAVAAAKPAPAPDLALPTQAEKSASESPPLRPASNQPEAPAAAPSEAPAAAAPAVQVDAPGGPVAGARYKVVRGDMLSDIALRVYGDASKFRMIQAANPSLRNKPNRILADQVIFIPADKR